LRDFLKIVRIVKIRKYQLVMNWLLGEEWVHHETWLKSVISSGVLVLTYRLRRKDSWKWSLTDLYLGMYYARPQWLYDTRQSSDRGIIKCTVHWVGHNIISIYTCSGWTIHFYIVPIVTVVTSHVNTHVNPQFIVLCMNI
jgi:hypothetical protein